MQDAIKERIAREKRRRVEKSVLKDIPGTESLGNAVEYNPGNDQRIYPRFMG